MQKDVAKETKKAYNAGFVEDTDCTWRILCCEKYFDCSGCKCTVCVASLICLGVILLLLFILIVAGRA